MLAFIFRPSFRRSARGRLFVLRRFPFIGVHRRSSAVSFVFRLGPIFLLALALRLWTFHALPFDVHHPNNVDAHGYHILATNLLTGRGLSIRTEPPYRPDGLRTPLYPVTIAASYAAFGPRAEPLLLGQAALDSLTTLLVALLAWRLAGTRAGLAAGAL